MNLAYFFQCSTFLSTLSKGCRGEKNDRISSEEIPGNTRIRNLPTKRSGDCVVAHIFHPQKYNWVTSLYKVSLSNFYYSSVMNWNQCFRIFRASFTCYESSFLLFFCWSICEAHPSAKSSVGHCRDLHSKMKAQAPMKASRRGTSHSLRVREDFWEGSYSESWDLNDNQAKIGWRKEEYRQKDLSGQDYDLRGSEEVKELGKDEGGRQGMGLESRIKKQALSSSFLEWNRKWQ